MQEQFAGDGAEQLVVAGIDLSLVGGVLPLKPKAHVSTATYGMCLRSEPLSPSITFGTKSERGHAP